MEPTTLQPKSEKKITKTKRLTKKERGFVKDYVKTENGTQAAFKNYDTTYETARSIASENLTKPHIIEAIKSIADSIPNELLAEKHLALLNKGDDKGIDIQAVSKGLDMAYKLKGSYAPEKSVNLNITHSTENRDKMTALAKEISKKLLNEEIE